MAGKYERCAKAFPFATAACWSARRPTGPSGFFVNPDENERKYLVEELKIDEHTLSSALDPDELSRFEFEPEHVAIIFKIPKNYSAADQFLFKVSSVGVFLFSDHLAVVAQDAGGLFNGKQNLRFASLKGIVLRMLGRAIIHFREHLKVISMISDELQEKINTSMENRNLISMFSLQKSLVYYVSALSSNGALLERLRNNAARLGFSSEEQEFLDDILIENNQCYRQADIYSNILASLMDARASIVSNNLNVLMKTLNIITIMIMVPTLVVSAFSMNVRIPMEENHYAFSIVMSLAVLSALAVLFVWRYRKM